MREIQESGTDYKFTRFRLRLASLMESVADCFDRRDNPPLTKLDVLSAFFHATVNDFPRHYRRHRRRH